MYQQLIIRSLSAANIRLNVQDELNEGIDWEELNEGIDPMSNTVHWCECDLITTTVVTGSLSISNLYSLANASRQVLFRKELLPVLNV